MVGCGKKEESTKPTIAAVTDSIGVAACDDYFKKVDRCANSPAQKAAIEETKARMRVVFRSMATAPGGKERLEADCLDHLARLPPSCGK